VKFKLEKKENGVIVDILWSLFGEMLEYKIVLNHIVREKFLNNWLKVFKHFKMWILYGDLFEL
jgi:hypothetical protein